MKQRLVIVVLIILSLVFAASLSAESDRIRIEAENYVAEVSNPAVANDPNKSGGKFIGIDSTTGHVVIYENIPASKAFIINHRTLARYGNVVIHVFIERNGEFEPLIDVPVEPTGDDWGSPFLDTPEIKVDIPASSRLKFTAMGSTSMDYFEFIPAVEEEQTENPDTGDIGLLQYAVYGIVTTMLLKKRSFGK